LVVAHWPAKPAHNVLTEIGPMIGVPLRVNTASAPPATWT